MLTQSASEGALERVHGYRKMAEHAQAMADASDLPQVKDAYQRSADRWTTLADLVELGGHVGPTAAAIKATGWRAAKRH